MAKIKNKYTLVRGDDWQGLYLNGELAIEDHRINLENAFNHVVQSGGVSEFSSVDCSCDWLSTVGHFPESLSDVKILDD